MLPQVGQNSCWSTADDVQRQQGIIVNPETVPMPYSSGRRSSQSLQGIGAGNAECVQVRR